ADAVRVGVRPAPPRRPVLRPQGHRLDRLGHVGRRRVGGKGRCGRGEGNRGREPGPAADEDRLRRTGGGGPGRRVGVPLRAAGPVGGRRRGGRERGGGRGRRRSGRRDGLGIGRRRLRRGRRGGERRRRARENEAKSKPSRKTKRVSWQRPYRHRNALQEAWLAVLRLPSMPPRTARRILQHLSSYVLGVAPSPLRFAEYFTRSYERGASSSGGGRLRGRADLDPRPRRPLRPHARPPTRVPPVLRLAVLAPPPPRPVHEAQDEVPQAAVEGPTVQHDAPGVRRGVVLQAPLPAGSVVPSARGSVLPGPDEQPHKEARGVRVPDPQEGRERGRRDDRRRLRRGRGRPVQDPSPRVVPMGALSAREALPPRDVDPRQVGRDRGRRHHAHARRGGVHGAHLQVAFRPGEEEAGRESGGGNAAGRANKRRRVALTFTEPAGLFGGDDVFGGSFKCS
ncbi:hypothetical protein THAOC_31673, partial [Thalassiosira oceanica]